MSLFGILRGLGIVFFVIHGILHVCIQVRLAASFKKQEWIEKEYMIAASFKKQEWIKKDYMLKRAAQEKGGIHGVWCSASTWMENGRWCIVNRNRGGWKRGVSN